MNTIPIEAFHPHILPLVQACPIELLNLQLVSTITDICNRTGCLTVEVTFKTMEKLPEYDVPMPSGLNFLMARQVFIKPVDPETEEEEQEAEEEALAVVPQQYAGVQLHSVRTDELTHYSLGLDPAQYVGTPRAYGFRRKGHMVLYPCPDKIYEVKVLAEASLDRGSMLIPEQFFNDYLDVVVNGTLARLHRVASQPFSSLRLATERRVDYEDGLRLIKSETARDFTDSTGRVFFNRIM
jgi:hypothetical protein